MTNILVAQVWWQERHGNVTDKPEICLHHWQQVVETNVVEGRANFRRVKMGITKHPQYHNH